MAAVRRSLEIVM